MAQLNFLFKRSSPLLPGAYLLGHAHWPVPMVLVSVRFTAFANSLEPTTLVLEVNGAPTEKTIKVQPTALGWLHSFIPLQYLLPAYAEVRWKCFSGPGNPENALTLIGLNLLATRASDATVPSSALTISWVNGQERLPLFEYQPATRQFVEVSRGIAVGRAEVVNAPNFRVSIQSALAMQIDTDRVLSVNKIVAIGGVGTSENPRVEFHAGRQRLATLTKAGTLRVADVNEENPRGGADRFELNGNGQLSASLGPKILVAHKIEEPLP